MNHKERATHWQNHINQWQETGLSGPQFCNQHGLNLAQFYYWKNKVLLRSSKAALDPKCPSGFATVVVADTPMVDEGLCFTLPNGCAIVGITGANVLLVGAILGQL